MSKDLIGKGGKRQVSSIRQVTTEAGEAAHARVGDLLFGVEPPPQDRTRIVLGIDATSSMGEFIPERRMTPEAARTMAESIYTKAPGAQVKIIAFRGDDILKGSPDWIETADELTRQLQAISHQAGWTQHCRLLRKVADWAKEQAIQQLIVVSDAFEQRTSLRPNGDELAAAVIHAQRLRELGVKISIGFKGVIRGACPLDRAGEHAEQAFDKIVQANGNQGHVFLFDTGPDLKKRFEDIATVANLHAKGDQIGVQRMLEHLKAVPFEMVVGEQVPSERCTAHSDESEA